MLVYCIKPFIIKGFFFALNLSDSVLTDSVVSSLPTVGRIESTPHGLFNHLKLAERTIF